ncbi:hypothetical protein KEM56_004126 [Ascosphaera pollenicola]|nr:hypothetical protein KEM56_004126 [Ascosphaera pollenicola]
MRFPGYLLNPGDMFQVDPELVMYATGAPKTGKQRRGGRQRRVRAKERREKEAQAVDAAEDGAAEAEANGKAEKEEKKATAAAATGKQETTNAAAAEEENHEEHRATLMQLLGRAKAITTATPGTNRPHKHRADFQEFRRLVRSTLSKTRAGAEKDEDIHDLEAQFSRLTMLVNKENEIHEKAQEAAKSHKKDEGRHQKQQDNKSQEPASTSTSTSSSTTDANNESLLNALLKPDAPASRAILSAIPASDLEILKQALQQVHENPIDTSKPYATPWRPRDYMSAFAFIPRYLEVNQNICAAVYVRHPVVRPGLAEVPTPFPESFNQAAFGWYLRRR